MGSKPLSQLLSLVFSSLYFPRGTPFFQKAGYRRCKKRRALQRGKELVDFLEQEGHGLGSISKRGFPLVQVYSKKASWSQKRISCIQTFRRSSPSKVPCAGIISGPFFLLLYQFFLYVLFSILLFSRKSFLLEKDSLILCQVESEEHRTNEFLSSALKQGRRTGNCIAQLRDLNRFLDRDEGRISVR